MLCFSFFFSSRRRHTRCLSDWSSDVCSSDLRTATAPPRPPPTRRSEPAIIRLPRSQRYLLRLPWLYHLASQPYLVRDRRPVHSSICMGLSEIQQGCQLRT